MNLVFWHGQEEVRLNLEEKGENIFQVALNGRPHAVRVEFLSGDELLLNIDGKVYNVIIHSNPQAHSVFVNEKFFKLEKKSALRILNGAKSKIRKREIKTTMPGRIVRILAAEGEELQEGQAVLVLEAMKMQNEIKSPQAGRLTYLRLKPGDHVETGAQLFSVE
jgi:biotin carboxyl carrier protein